MSSIASRANSLMTVGMYAMTAVALSAFLSTNFLDMTFPADIKLNKLQIKNIQEFETRSSRNDVASMTFDVTFKGVAFCLPKYHLSFFPVDIDLK